MRRAAWLRHRGATLLDTCKIVIASSPISEIESIEVLGLEADVWFLDIWGVLHNGVRPFGGAVDVCRRFRFKGGRVILVSNSPRPRDGVVRQLDQIGVPRDVYDAVLTSGDVSRTLIARYEGAAVFHLGPERDMRVYDGLGVLIGVLEEAKAIVCTGLFDDETETPETYRGLLAKARERRLEMICVNPDVKVERGGRMIYCAGSIAQAYEAMGGLVHYAGKPFAPIYEAAMRMSEDLCGHAVSKARILAIGDGVATDIKGACDAGITAVYVASAVNMGRGETLSDAAVRLFPDPARRPVAVMSALV